MLSGWSPGTGARACTRTGAPPCACCSPACTGPLSGTAVQARGDEQRHRQASAASPATREGSHSATSAAHRHDAARLTVAGRAGRRIAASAVLGWVRLGARPEAVTDHDGSGPPRQGQQELRALAALPHACRRPPCSRASSEAIDRPRPVPPVVRARAGSARQKRLKTSDDSPGRSPMPWSRTAIATTSSSATTCTSIDCPRRARPR